MSQSRLCQKRAFWTCTGSPARHEVPGSKTDVGKLWETHGKLWETRKNLPPNFFEPTNGPRASFKSHVRLVENCQNPRYFCEPRKFRRVMTSQSLSILGFPVGYHFRRRTGLAPAVSGHHYTCSARALRLARPRGSPWAISTRRSTARCTSRRRTSTRGGRTASGARLAASLGRLGARPRAVVVIPPLFFPSD